MAFIYAETVDELGPERSPASSYPEVTPAHASAVSWGAIVAGAVAAAALSLILLMLGVGLGLSSVSPWGHYGINAAKFGVSTILWVTLTQLLACAMGGYLAGRLRTKWVAVHTDEVYFRDTAHGFLAWAVASLATAALLTSVIGSIVGTGIQAGATVAGSVASNMGVATAGGPEIENSDHAPGPMGYFVDSLFRKDQGTTTVATAAPRSEVSRIFANTVFTGPLPADDLRYVGQLVAQRSGLSQLEAEKRVTDTYARLQAKLGEAQGAVRDAADKARKASAYAALWLFISLLIAAYRCIRRQPGGDLRRPAARRLTAAPKLPTFGGNHALTHSAFSWDPDPNHHFDRIVRAIATIRHYNCKEKP